MMETHRAAFSPRVLVTDAVPVNGGDEALLVGLLRSLSQRWGSPRFTVLCQRPDESRRLLPDLAIEPALTHDGDISSVERWYREADVVVSTPGGFLHEHYDIETALRGFNLAHRFNKPLALFAQSIGPFSNEKNRALIRCGLDRAALIAVRDRLSVQHLAECGIAGERVVHVPDVAFLWRRLAPTLYKAKAAGRPRRVGLCFRRWPLRDVEESTNTIAKGRRLIEHLSSRGIEEFLFVSTCQGTPGYVDDSELAVRIVEGLTPALRSRCVVDRTRYHTEELIRILSDCDLMVSMRLHGCLLAMLGGTPAMGLAYESKTPEIFGQLGLKKYQVPFTSYQTRWCQCASGLLDDLDAVREGLPATLDVMGFRVRRGLAHLDALLPQL
jgi:colanic acid/amylovoran biosynthesis protein